MKAINILRLRGGTELQEEALAKFVKHGPTGGTEWLMSSVDTKTYVSLGDLDNVDMAGMAMYAPYFDIETIPVVEVGEDWVKSMHAGVEKRNS